MSRPTVRIPAIVNVSSGTADEARTALGNDESFEVHEVEPDALASTVRTLVTNGASRVLVAGGDGTIATAAATLLETKAELAVLPGGTLNHFARDLGISTDAAEAIALAVTGSTRGVDVGMVNGRIFLNTSSVGAYVRFVRVRESLERWFGYRLASALAALRILFSLRRMGVEVVVDGQTRIYRSPLVFIGVGERDMQFPGLGQRIPSGRRGLHVIVVRGRSSARTLALGLAAVARGIGTVTRTPEFESFIVEELRIDMKGMGTVAVDGEIAHLTAPLRFELRRDALAVVCPPLTAVTDAPG